MHEIKIIFELSSSEDIIDSNGNSVLNNTFI